MHFIRLYLLRHVLPQLLDLHSLLSATADTILPNLLIRKDFNILASSTSFGCAMVQPQSKQQSLKRTEHDDNDTDSTAALLPCRLYIYWHELQLTFVSSTI
jgi:hypothetical protein